MVIHVRDGMESTDDFVTSEHLVGLHAPSTSNPHDANAPPKSLSDEDVSTKYYVIPVEDSDADGVEDSDADGMEDSDVPDPEEGVQEPDSQVKDPISTACAFAWEAIDLVGIHVDYFDIACSFAADRMHLDNPAGFKWLAELALYFPTYHNPAAHFSGPDNAPPPQPPANIRDYGFSLNFVLPSDGPNIRRFHVVDEGPHNPWKKVLSKRERKAMKKAECSAELSRADGNSKEPFKCHPPPTSTRSITVDDSLPSTSIQIRFADGHRVVARFNMIHTISDIRDFIDATRPGEGSQYMLQVGFPPKTLNDVTKTVEEAGVANSVIFQRI